MSDCGPLVSAAAASLEHEGYDPQTVVDGPPSPEWFEPTCSKPPGDDAYNNLLVVEAGNAVVGHARLTWWTEKDDTRLYLSNASLLPACRNRGIGTAMLQWAQHRLAAIARLQSTNATGPAALGANASQTQTQSAQLLADNGYREAFRLVELLRPDLANLPQVTWPQGIELRPLEPLHFRAVGRSVAEAYLQRPPVWLTGEALEQNLARQEPQQIAWLAKFDPELCCVAWAGDQVAGQVFGRLRPGCGEVAEVSVRAPYRRLGLARTLICELLHRLSERGISQSRMYARGDNTPAITLYKSMNFKQINWYGRYRKDMPA